MGLVIVNDLNIFKKGVVGNVRLHQEDCHDIKVMTPNGDVYVVCDGMGGHVGGAKASSLAVNSIISYLNEKKYENPIEALNGALQFANMQILGFAQMNPEFRGMGTTACVLLVQGNEAWIAHVGDSRIYLYLGKERQLHRLTKDHSYVQALVDAGEITDDEMETHPNKNRILKALGIQESLTPSFNPNNQPILPKNGDVFLICTDGLTGMISDKTIQDILSTQTSLENKGELLISRAMEGEITQPGGQDNCTIELIQISNSPWKKSCFISFNPYKNKQTSSIRKTPSRRLMHCIYVVLVIIVTLIISSVTWRMIEVSNINRKNELINEYKNLKNEESRLIDERNKNEEIKKKQLEKNDVDLAKSVKELALSESALENNRKKQEEIKLELVENGIKPDTISISQSK